MPDVLEISAERLISTVTSYNPNSDSALIERAFVFARDMHDGQYRKSGEPYITHPLAVAQILAEQRLDDATIITALLHDTVEDTEAETPIVAEKFGWDVAHMVEGVTKLTQLPLNSLEDKQGANVRKLLLASAKNVRVVLVKLADRLHNMRTIASMRPEKQLIKARETMEIFAPLAARMGMQKIREELEDLAFAVINPDGRKSIIRRFAKLKKESGDVIANITNDIIHELSQTGITVKVYGREKRPYSIWRKMEEKNIGFSRLSDIYGFRVLVETDAQCYQVLGIIHKRWRSVPGRFKDYISQPKENGYRSLHTTVSGRDGKRVEVQIRTHQMHDAAEAGVAAHWSYRNGERAENPFSIDPSRWISDVVDNLNSTEDHQDFLEDFKLEMYADKVFCFTPKGKVVNLPRGATPIDFAFRIHTRIGSTCVGANVDGRRVPLDTKLRNGQSVEILCAEGQVPKRYWLSQCITGRAKSAIRKSLKDAELTQTRAFGYELARAAFARINKPLSDKVLEAAARNLSLKNADAVLERLGQTKLRAQHVIEAVHPDIKVSAETQIDPDHAIVGLRPDQRFQRAPCCAPLPGERVVGITHEGQGVVVHAIDCAQLAHYEDATDRWIDLHWSEGVHATVYDISVEMALRNDAGVLGRICTLIGQQKANISNLEFMDRQSDYFKMRFTLDLRDAEQWHALLLDLETEVDIATVTRVPLGPSRL